MDNREKYPWELDKSMKKCVNNNKRLFLQPEALNLLASLADILSDREMDHVRRLRLLNANEDVMWQLLEYLMKRPRWWEKLHTALMDAEYGEQANLLAGAVERHSQQHNAAPQSEHTRQQTNTPYSTHYTDTLARPGQQPYPSSSHNVQPPPPYESVAPWAPGQTNYRQPAALPASQRSAPPPVSQQSTPQQPYQQSPPLPEYSRFPAMQQRNDPGIRPRQGSQQQQQQTWDAYQRSEQRLVQQEHLPDYPSLVMADQNNMLQKYKGDSVCTSDISDLDLCQKKLCEEKERAKGTLKTEMQQQHFVEPPSASVSLNQKKVSQKDDSFHNSHLCNPEEKINQNNGNQKDKFPVGEKYYSEERHNADITHITADEATVPSSHSARPDSSMQTTSSQMPSTSAAMQHLGGTTKNSSINLEIDARMCSVAAVCIDESDVRNSSSNNMNVCYPPKTFDSAKTPIHSKGSGDAAATAIAEPVGLPPKLSSVTGIHALHSVCYPPGLSSSEDQKVCVENSNSPDEFDRPSMPRREVSRPDTTTRNDCKALRERIESTECIEAPSTVESNENNETVPRSDLQPMIELEKKEINVSQSIHGRSTSAVDSHSESNGDKVDKADKSHDGDIQSVPSVTGNRPRLSLLVSSMSEKCTSQQPEHSNDQSADNARLEEEVNRPLFRNNSSGSLELQDISTVNKYLEEDEDRINRENIQSLLPSSVHMDNDIPSVRINTEDFEKLALETTMAGTVDKRVRDHVPSEKALQATVEEAGDHPILEKTAVCEASLAEHVEVDQVVKHPILEDDARPGVERCDKTPQSIKVHDESQTSGMGEVGSRRDGNKVGEMTSQPDCEEIQTHENVDHVSGCEREFANTEINESFSEGNHQSDDATSSVVSQRDEPSAFRSLLTSPFTRTVIEGLFNSLK